MINQTNFKQVLEVLGFESQNEQLSKHFPAFDARMIVDFTKEVLIYPEDKGLQINERQTCNFSANENFVVFECVCRLLDKGYKPEHIELEPKWKLGHGASGGRADILVRDNTGKSLLIIECKNAGSEFNKHWKKTLEDGDQLFGYAQQESNTQFLCLYTADWLDDCVVYESHIITLQDNEKLLEERKHQNPLSYRVAKDRDDRYRAWKETYLLDYATQGLFEPDIPAYEIGKTKFTVHDLKQVSSKDTQSKHHAFATILRKYNVSGRENAFDKLVNLLLCKIVDETNNADDLKFYWKGVAYDSPFDLQDRMQLLYKEGMRRFLGEEITYIGNEQIDNAFWAFLGDKDATKNKIKEYFKQLKFFTNNDFAFIEVHNEALFYQNAAVLRDIVRLFEDTRIKGDTRNQFLGDMFEIFLDQGVKQSEGQFFTPMPITRFIISCLPLEKVIEDSQHPPRCLDYACGAGHFLNELASQMQLYVSKHQKGDIQNFYQAIEGIEKEYRLSKVAKVSAFMYGQDNISITYADALSKQAETPLASYDVLVANPPYSVKGFLETLTEEERDSYTLSQTVQNIANNNSIETFFIERAKQLLAGNGVAGIIFPSSILSNADSTYTTAREILLKYFDIIAICEFGSGTFGKTGTNTVTLFMRRKAAEPQPAEHYRNRVEQWFTKPDDANEAKRQTVFLDEHFIKQYCNHITVEFEAYKTLLQGDANQALMQLEGFAEYKKAFEGLTSTVQRKKQKSYKDLKEIDQAIEMRKKLTAYIQGIEKEKLYYFVLASINPTQVVIVKSPSDTKEAKAFLGYEWSNAKGNEGIKLMTDAAGKHLTPLYEEGNPRNPAKINYYIERAFLGEAFEIPEHLQAFVTSNRLVDMLDFSRTEFNKQISLSPKNANIIESQWAIKKLSDLIEIIGGGTPDTKNPTYWNGGIPWLSVVDFNSDERYVTTTEKTISEEGLKNSSAKYLQANDLIISARGTVGALAQLVKPMTFNQSCYGLRSKGEVTNDFLYYVLKQEVEQFRRNAYGSKFDSITTRTFSDIKIPVPPPAIQEQIVQECEVVDNNCKQAKNEIVADEQEIQKKIKQLIDDNETALKKLSTVCDFISGGTPDTNKKEYWNGDIPWLSVADFKQTRRYVYTAEKKITKAGLENSSTKILNAGDLIISARGTVGAIAQLGKPMAFNQSCYGIRVKEGADNGFLLYILRSQVDQLLNNAYGSKFDAITIRTFDSIKIPVPPLSEQQLIVAEITAIEEKIQTAQTIIDEAVAKKAAILKKYL
ncbi:restriction endonuclease subunit S [Thiolinea disciformis]|uniref:restriction endonuclease subunit S n=1 Tax=Thiolinea disciformis TaxID=125614 RepID=UPI00035FCA63|nr:restriction endonuclease subunit S [Thiolinea disciformis]